MAEYREQAADLWWQQVFDRLKPRCALGVAFGDLLECSLSPFGGEASPFRIEQQPIFAAHSAGKPPNVLPLNLLAGVAADEVVRQPLTGNVEARF